MRALVLVSFFAGLATPALADACPERQDQSTALGLKSTTLGDSSGVPALTTRFGFEFSEIAAIDDSFWVAPEDGDAGAPTGAKAYRDPNVVLTLGDPRAGTTTVLNSDTSVALGRAAVGEGYMSVWANGSSLTSQLQWHGIPAFRNVRFKAMLGFLLSTSAPQADAAVQVQFKIKQNGIYLFTADLKVPIQARGCRDGGDFRRLNGSIPNPRAFLRECNYVDFDFPLDPTRFLSSDPVTLTWEVATPAGFANPPVGSAAYLSIDELAIDFQEPELTCAGMRSTEPGGCQLSQAIPGHRFRITDDQGRQTLISASTHPMNTPAWSTAVNRPGLYRLDGVCLGARTPGTSQQFACGKSSRMAVYWQEPKRPGAVIARLTGDTAIVFPPPPSCYTQGATEYEIQDPAGQMLARLPIAEFEQNGYLYRGLLPNLGTHVWTVPHYGTTRGLPGVSETTYWLPVPLRYTLDHFPVEGEPARLVVTTVPSPLIHQQPRRVRASMAPSVPGATTLLGLTQPGGAVTGALPTLVGARVADASRPAALQADVHVTHRTPAGSDLLNSIWITTGELGERLDDRQRAKALEYFGDPSRLAQDHAKCFFEDPAVPLMSGPLSPGQNLCDCKFIGNYFDCRTQEPSNAQLVTVPVPPRQLARDLKRFYYTATPTRYQGPLGRPVTMLEEGGLLAKSAWNAWVSWRQAGPNPLYPRDFVDSFSTRQREEYSWSLATWEFLRILAWDQKPGNNLFRARSSLAGDWLQAFDHLFVGRYVLPIRATAYSDAIRGYVDDIYRALDRLLFGWDLAYNAVSGRPNTLAEYVLLDSTRAWIQNEFNAAVDPGLWNLQTLGLAPWPGEISRDDCGPLGCTTAQQLLLPQCGPSDSAVYQKKFSGYAHRLQRVPGIVTQALKIPHARTQAFEALRRLLEQAVLRKELRFSDYGKPREMSTLGQVGLAVPYRVSHEVIAGQNAWIGNQVSLADPTIEELRRESEISLNHWYCRGTGPAAASTLLHEGAHALHALGTLFRPESAAVFDGLAPGAEARKLYNQYLMWTEYRAFRFEYCTDSAHYGAGGFCHDERALFELIFFGTAPRGFRAKVPEPVRGPRDTYLKSWAEAGLCGNPVQCKDMADIRVDLPIGDLCNPITGRRGACLELP